MTPEDGDPPTRIQLAFYILGIIALVINSGISAGLQVSLFSIDRLMLQIMSTTGSPANRSRAKKLLRVLNLEHWTLVALILFNASVMMSLPILLERVFDQLTSLIISITAVLFLAEAIPLAMFVRYAVIFCSALNWVIWTAIIISAPISYPVGKLLDWLFGVYEDLLDRNELAALIAVSKTSDDDDERDNSKLPSLLSSKETKAALHQRIKESAQSAKSKKKLSCAVDRYIHNDDGNDNNYNNEERTDASTAETITSNVDKHTCCELQKNEKNLLKCNKSSLLSPIERQETTQSNLHQSHVFTISLTSEPNEKSSVTFNSPISYTSQTSNKPTNLLWEQQHSQLRSPKYLCREVQEGLEMNEICTNRESSALHCHDKLPHEDEIDVVYSDEEKADPFELQELEVKMLQSALQLSTNTIKEHIRTTESDAFMLSSREVLNRDTIQIILQRGYSRIPVYFGDDRKHIIGALIVDSLIPLCFTNPETAPLVGDYPLRELLRLTETSSLYDAYMAFRTGTSNMAVVYHSMGAMVGLFTLTDVLGALYHANPNNHVPIPVSHLRRQGKMMKVIKNIKYMNASICSKSGMPEINKGSSKSFDNIHTITCSSNATNKLETVDIPEDCREVDTLPVEHIVDTTPITKQTTLVETATATETETEKSATNVETALLEKAESNKFEAETTVNNRKDKSITRA